MAAELIGRCRCPICGSDKGRLTLAKSLLPVITCNGCNVQCFARSDVSDRHFRALLIAEPAQAAAPPAPAPASVPATIAPPHAKPTGSGWGLFGARQ